MSARFEEIELETLAPTKPSIASNHGLIGNEMRDEPSSSSAARDADATAAAHHHRVIHAGRPDRNMEALFERNIIRTTKYRWYNFLPKNLFEQFHRFANVYFLIIVILNWIPIVGAFQPVLGMMPLLFVLSVTAIKDIHEDRRRYRSDLQVNRRIAEEVLEVTETGYVWTPRAWEEIEVGDMVRLRDGDMVPADMVLVHASEEHGVCYIDTANLDGETNLKQRRAVRATACDAYGRADAEFECDAVADDIVVTCEPPNANIYQFNGFLKSRYVTDATPLGPTSIALRGCILRNTNNVVGVAVYCGLDTKAMLNNRGPPSKRSKVERDMNSEVIMCVLLLCAMCLFCAFGAGLWTGDRNWQDILYIPYSPGDPNPAGWGGIIFLTWIIVLQVIVPISLYVTVELVKLGQVFFMMQDVTMYHEETDRPMVCRALNLNEDLGQIEYVFSDKTGTLTQNKMVFRKCSIAGENYKHVGSAVSVGASEAAARGGLASQGDLGMHGGASSSSSTTAAIPPRDTLAGLGLYYIDGELFDMDSGLLMALERGDESATEFIFLLAICNTVVPAAKDGRLNYSSESPDERALVVAAHQYGIRLLSRSSDLVVVDVRGVRKEFRVLHTIEFDSGRKRMSLIVRLADGRVRLYCKGADSIIRTRLVDPTDADPLVVSTQTHLDYYASEGLRTLSCAYRDIPTDEYEKWSQQYAEAQLAIEERQEKVNAVAESIEQGLVLLGATGIEDRLQDGVPEAIAQIRKAGVRVWVITGDKQETAINIGFSCRLLEEDMPQIIVNAETEEETRTFILAAIERYGVRTGEGINPGLQHALIIDGVTLAYALQPRIKPLLLELSSFCSAVLACRTTPLQKASIVSMVREGLGVMTLAIGDGANDVSMIQSADVGVGISGQEGMQAVMASDFAIAQFRYLERLMLVHGHLNYYRLANMVLYFFYKNTMYVFVLFLFAFYSGYSGQVAIDQIYLLTYNLIFTSVPPIIAAIYDEDASAASLLRHPALYAPGRLSKIYNRRNFWLTLLNSFYQACVVFFFVLGAYRNERHSGLWAIGTVWNTASVMTVSLQLAIEQKKWNWLTHVAIWGSIVVYWGFAFIYNLFVAWPVYFVIETIAGEFKFWAVVTLSTFFALLPYYTLRVYNALYRPEPCVIIREQELQRGDTRRRLTAVPLTPPEARAKNA